MWWAIAASAASALSSANAASKQNKALARENIAQNEAIIKANVANTIRTGYRAGLLNMQRGLSRRMAQQKGFEQTKEAGAALGVVTANQAASGTIGASADAVAQDVRMKLGEAQAAQQDENELMELNFDTQLHELVQQGQDAVQSPAKLKLQSSGDIRGNALLAGLTTFGSMYASSKFNLGLGNSGSKFYTGHGSSGTSSIPSSSTGFNW